MRKVKVAEAEERSYRERMIVTYIRHLRAVPWCPPCLSQFKLGSQSTAKWVAYKQQRFISHSSGGWKSEIRVPGWSGLVGPIFQVADFSLNPHVVESKGFSFIRVLILFMKAEPSWLNHLSKSPLLIPSHWGLRFQCMGLREGHKHSAQGTLPHFLLLLLKPNSMRAGTVCLVFCCVSSA